MLLLVMHHFAAKNKRILCMQPEAARPFTPFESLRNTELVAIRYQVYDETNLKHNELRMQWEQIG